MLGGAGAAVPAEAMRLAWVDVAKGICILLVVMMHSTLGTGAAMDGEGFLHTAVAFAKPFRIPDFFLLSGLFLGRVIDRPWRLFADRRVVHFAYFYGLWVVIQSLAKYPAIVGETGPGAFAAHLLHALVEPYSTLWFIYLLAVFSVATKLLRRVPPLMLLAGAALLQIVPIATPSYLLEEFCGRYVYFLAGYIFADRIFALADRAAAAPRIACAGLMLWAGLEAWLAFAPSRLPGYPTLASLPGVALILGGAGALAIVTGAAVLTAAGGPVAAALRACGRRSIVIYLAFFLPMAAMRTLLVKADLIADVGLASLTVMAVAVIVPLALERAVRGTALRFLFVRPKAFHIAAAPRPRTPALQAA